MENERYRQGNHTVGYMENERYRQGNHAVGYMENERYRRGNREAEKDMLRWEER